jgi:RNA polymerase sigma-70 factor (ECF subfamily)
LSIDTVSAPSVGARLAQGDEHALEECYRLYGPMVRRYLRHFVPSDEADDLLQIVFLEVWRCRDRLDASRPFEAWLFGIARKRAIDQLRRRHHEVVSVDAIRELSGDDGDDFVERLAWAAEVRSALTQLSVDQQEVIELSYFGDLTQQQIAGKLDIPIGTVKARVARGMRRLAALVDGGELA